MQLNILIQIWKVIHVIEINDLKKVTDDQIYLQGFHNILKLPGQGRGSWGIGLAKVFFVDLETEYIYFTSECCQNIVITIKCCESWYTLGICDNGPFCNLWHFIVISDKIYKTKLRTYCDLWHYNLGHVKSINR